MSHEANRPGDGDEVERPGMHGHEHEHDGELHAHPHHHRGPEAHEHRHMLGFERYSYLCSPIHELDPRAKVIAAFIAIVAIVLSPAPRPAEFAALFLLLASVALIAELPLGAMLVRSAVVLPVAGGIALFAPLATLGAENAATVAEAYATGWPLAWSIISKAWLSASIVLLVSATTTPSRLFNAMRALKTPAIFITMLTFLYRYAAVLSDQLASMRRGISSRAPSLKGWRLVSLYGNLAGNLFIRAYERGERVHAAMLSRGFNGTLPTAERLQAGPADAFLVLMSLMVAAAVVLY